MDDQFRSAVEADARLGTSWAAKATTGPVPMPIGATQIPKLPGVHLSLNDLQEKSERVCEGLEILSSRLQNVCAPQSPTDGRPGVNVNPVRPACSPIVDRISAVTGRLDSACATINDLMNRLDI